jgi:hypothetical protein
MKGLKGRMDVAKGDRNEEFHHPKQGGKQCKKLRSRND